MTEQNISNTPKDLLRTPLYALHQQLEAKMVPFAGYTMPVQYPMGLQKEHLHTREKAGLFDVSHMGQLRLCGENAPSFLETLVPVDIIDLPVGKQRYALFTNEQGGVVDDLMVTRESENSLYLVVNASRKQEDLRLLQGAMPDDVRLELLDDRALIALQGPKAHQVMAELAPQTARMVFMDSEAMTIEGIDTIVSRSGYTGEDGFEISLPSDSAEMFCKRLLESESVEMVGLGARDSLRLESGLCLYGNDLDSETTPIESSLVWAISKIRRSEGDRAGGFPGADVILSQIEQKNHVRKRIGLIGSTRAPIRKETILTNSEGKPVGRVTSGTFGPSVGAPVALAYVESGYWSPGTELLAEVRGKKLPVSVCSTPFVKQRYFRG